MTISRAQEACSEHRWANLIVLLGVALLGWTSPARAVQGDLDTSFGGSGVVHETFGASARFGAVAIQEDGKIVAAGGVVAATTAVALARYNPDGTLDSSFGTGGLVTATAVSAGASDLVVQPDGKIVTLGDSSGDFVLARFESDGALDSTFGTGGVVTADCGAVDRASALVLQPDGKLVAAGSRLDGGASSMCLARYTTDGSVDPSFGGDGVVTAIDGGAYGLALLPDGKLLAAGFSGYDLAVARFNGDGTVDAAFGAAGVAQASFGPLGAGAFALVVQPNGRIVAAGSAGDDLALARFLANGALDASFGLGGIVTTDLGQSEYALALALQRDGKLLIAGSMTWYIGPPLGWMDSFVVARYDEDGTLDPVFGVGGVASDLAGSAAAIALQPDGRAVVAGGARVFGTADSEALLARYHSLVIPCTPAALAGCKTPIVAGAARLKIKHPTSLPAKDQLQWQWRKGAATTLADFGDPVATDEYTLCLYDESAGGSSLAGGAVVPAGGSCGRKACWKPVSTSGFGYGDHDRTRFGIGTIKLKSGEAGAAKMIVKGQGPALPLPPLPLALPLRVQLVSANGQCWDATFSQAGMQRSDAERFQGKGD